MDKKRLLLQLNQTFQKYMGPIFYSLFIMIILETLAAAVITSPATMYLSREGLAAQNKLFSILFLILTVIAWLTFQFGFAILLLRLTRNEKAGPAFIFLGFKKFNPAGKVILSFAGIIAIISAVTRFVAFFLSSKVYDRVMEAFAKGEIEVENAEVLKLAFDISFFSIIFFILCFVILIRFAFVFHLHFDEPSLSVPQLFGKSNFLLKGKILTLIGLALRAGGKNLITAITLAVITFLLPEKKGAAGVLSMLINLIYFINFYSAMVKIYLSVPVLYNELINPIH